MKGSESYQITRPNSQTIDMLFDRPISEDIWIRFSISLPGGFVDETGIKNLIVQNVFWSIGGGSKASAITAYLQGLNADYVIQNMEISNDDITYVELLASSTKQNRYINDAARIEIV